MNAKTLDLDCLIEECLENASVAGHCSSVVPLPTLISSLMIWWLAACCSSPLVRVIVLPCLVVSIIPVYSSSPARMLPLPSQSPAPPGLILMVLSKIHLAAQLRCQRRSLHSTLFYTLQHTATVTASVEMFFGSFRPKGSLLMLILFMQVVEQ